MYSQNESQLIALGNRIGQLLRAGDVVILTGDLGTGKTTLTKGIAQGLDIGQMIKSPTYTIVREYEGRLSLYHLDVYRIGDDSTSIDLDDFLYGGGVTVIEWGELLDSALFDDVLTVTLSREGEGRRVTLKAQGRRSQELVEEITHGS